MPFETDNIERFRKKIGCHVCGVTREDRDLPPVIVVAEVKPFDVHVPSTGSHLAFRSEFNGTTVVFEEFTVNSGLGGEDAEAVALHLFRNFHEWDGCFESLR